jgi:DNA repair photolyase
LAAATSARFRFAYIGASPAARAHGLAVCRAIAARARANEDLVAAQLAQTAAEGNSRIREVRVSRALDPVVLLGAGLRPRLRPAARGTRRFHTLSPYVGCLIGCRFCYAQSHVARTRSLSGLPAVPWGSYVDVRTNIADVLAAELESDEVDIVKMCPIVSDPYHVIEEKKELTRACLEVMARARRPPRVLVLTRSTLIERDKELLGAAGAYAGFSVPTADDAVREHFEPRAASVEARFAALAALRARGAKTFVVIQPLLPGSITALADGVAACCTSASIDVLHGIEGAGREFSDERYAQAADPAWQRDTAAALAEALVARGVVLWNGELPPELVRA